MRPRMRRLSSRAMPMASGPWMASESPTIARLRPTAAWKIGSVSART